MPLDRSSQNNTLKDAPELASSIWQISQSHLSQFTQCPRKFQYRYLEYWELPTCDSQRDQQTLGSQFHNLLQQREMGLDIQPFLKDSPRLKQWFEALQKFPPPFITGERRSEHQQAMVCEGFMLVAVYDLLIQNSQQAQILDWKTYTRPRNLSDLQNDWQARLYPYLLVETSSYSPEQVSMVYWFAQIRGKDSHFLVLPYDSKQHQQTQKQLRQVLLQLRQNLLMYEDSQDFSQAPLQEGHCYRHEQVCSFLARCRVRSQVFAGGEALDAIAEIPL